MMLRVMRWYSAVRSDHGQADVPAAFRPPLRAMKLDNKPLGSAAPGEVVNSDVDLSHRDGICVDTAIRICHIHI